MPELPKQDAFLKLYLPIHDRFARYCQTRMANSGDAKDLISETALVAYEKFDTVRHPEAFLSFLFSIANSLLNKMARRHKFWGKFKENDTAKIKDLSPDAETATDNYILYQALEQLPSEQKEAIIMFEISGFTLKEIQDIQQVSLSAVKARLVRGRIRLAKILKDPETDFYLSKGILSVEDPIKDPQPKISAEYYKAI